MNMNTHTDTITQLVRRVKQTLVETKGSPISKAPVKRAQHIVPPGFCERGGASDDDLSPRRAGRVTQSHPGCHRQWCRLHPEPHQSPIRIKAWEDPHEITPAPGTSCPRQPSGPGCVHRMQAQDVWLPEGANPIMAHNRGVSVPPPVAREIPGGRLRLIGSAGSRPNPFASSQPHPSSTEPSRRRGTNRTAPARATCDNRRAPAYGPPPSAPPGDVSVPAYADRHSGSRSRSEWRSGPLQ